jgi:hypothetical protein
VVEGVVGLDQHARQRRLAGLPRSGEQHDLAREVGCDTGGRSIRLFGLPFPKSQDYSGMPARLSRGAARAAGLCRERRIPR